MLQLLHISGLKSYTARTLFGEFALTAEEGTGTEMGVRPVKDRWRREDVKTPKAREDAFLSFDLAARGPDGRAFYPGPHELHREEEGDADTEKLKTVVFPPIRGVLGGGWENDSHTRGGFSPEVWSFSCRATTGVSRRGGAAAAVAPASPQSAFAVRGRGSSAAAAPGISRQSARAETEGGTPAAAAVPAPPQSTRAVSQGGVSAAASAPKPAPPKQKAPAFPVSPFLPVPHTAEPTWKLPSKNSERIDTQFLTQTHHLGLDSHSAVFLPLENVEGGGQKIIVFSHLKKRQVRKLSDERHFGAVTILSCSVKGDDDRMPFEIANDFPEPQWQKVRAEGGLPQIRDLFASTFCARMKVLDNTLPVVAMFGGRKELQKRSTRPLLDDFFFMELPREAVEEGGGGTKEFRWHKVPLPRKGTGKKAGWGAGNPEDPDVPPDRHSHSLDCVGNRFFVFGGVSYFPHRSGQQEPVLGDMWMLSREEGEREGGGWGDLPAPTSVSDPCLCHLMDTDDEEGEDEEEEEEEEDEDTPLTSRKSYRCSNSSRDSSSSGSVPKTPPADTRPTTFIDPRQLMPSKKKQRTDTDLPPPSVRTTRSAFKADSSETLAQLDLHAGAKHTTRKPKPKAETPKPMPPPEPEEKKNLTVGECWRCRGRALVSGWKWSQITPQKEGGEGKQPCPRFLHSTATVGPRIVLFGGHKSKGEFLSDLYSFDTVSWLWTEIEIDIGCFSSSLPASPSSSSSSSNASERRALSELVSPRGGAALSFDGRDGLWIFGGSTVWGGQEGSDLSDFYYLRLGPAD
uniref:Uncharacterized protein n=1 Tax=Chromera velia CCMP2878 TaxID=1169474 RepID=A0A0G4ICQ2_9ALVE|eukprot:Cvel_13211.t1-p1 / transcript=Cvel_13211.t1 / gene=Cvel_13211 / organism=Chromera_velia_CCMP2878 / gene_product=hypothetical protein / transcript_product=hypothetical protein / location=Cvel_scaffold894:30282-34513(+) / protein_length=795 / sequence_SO=supercontig / SO=protein_coding / is_pseudo=false